jgi:hypothetical protein
MIIRYAERKKMRWRKKKLFCRFYIMEEKLYICSCKPQNETAIPILQAKRGAKKAACLCWIASLRSQ